MKTFFEGLSRWKRIGIGFLLLVFYSNSAKLYYPERVIVGGAFAFLFLAFVILCIIYKYVDPKIEQQRQAEEQRIQAEEQRKQDQEARLVELAEKRRIEKQEREARQIEWEQHHGRIESRVSGVTFKNEDGSSRQAILKEAYFNDCIGDLSFQEYNYNGSPAIRVLYDDMCVGNIPKSMVKSILEVWDRITATSIYVESFIPDDEDEDEDTCRKRPQKIYRADVTFVYSKD